MLLGLQPLSLPSQAPLKPRVVRCQLPTGTGDCSDAVGTPLHRMGTPHGDFIPTGKTSPGSLGIGWSCSISGRLGTVRDWGTAPVQLQPVFELKWPKLAQIPRSPRGLFDLFPLLGVKAKTHNGAGASLGMQGHGGSRGEGALQCGAVRSHVGVPAA